MYRYLASQENKSKSKIKQLKITNILRKKEKQALFCINRVKSIILIKAKNQKFELFIIQLN